MSVVYVTQNGAKVGVDTNRLVITYKDGMIHYIPLETLKSLHILAKASITEMACIECMKRGIPIAYYSKGGAYFGRLQSTGHVNVKRQRLQCELYDSEFALELSKKLIKGKIHNQEVVLRRYARSWGIDLENNIKSMKIFASKLEYCESVEQIIGYEGNAARIYFDGLSEIIDEDFKFRGRSRRPPMDEFNSLISFGYSVLMNEIYGMIENHGLNPYFGFVHRDKEKHPTLVSDMMEEWRAIIVDSVALSLINGHEILKEDFYTDIEQPGCFISKEGIKKFLNKLEDKFMAKNSYLKYVDYTINYRHSIDMQIQQLVKAIEEKDSNLYNPIWIR